jgi:uncharacterized phage protein gp47/JayE
VLGVLCGEELFMALNTQTFTQIVQQCAAYVQGAASALVDFTVGSICRVLMEANAAIVMWLQGLVLQVAALTRAATSNGSDLDSWANDFGFVRLAATAATGQVTFSRFTDTMQAVVPVGAVVQTADGTQTYTVNLDTTNGAYNAALNAFVIAAGTASVSVTVTAVNNGAQGNATAGAINTLGQAITYVDTVTNASPFSTGQNAETDAAFRTRFVAWLNSLSKATLVAIQYVIQSLGNVASYTITANYAYNGTYQPGYFYVVADDGSGNPPTSFLNAVSAAVGAVRGFTLSWGVFGPSIVKANVAMTTGAQQSNVQAALQNYINGLGVGNSLSYARLAQVAFDAVPAGSFATITNITLNGGTSDLSATNQQVIRAGTITVS